MRSYLLLALALLLIPAMVSAAAPVSSFTVDNTGGISPLVVNFTDSSTNTPTIWKWYADKLSGSSSLFNSTQNPFYVPFTTGNYSIMLNASNAAVGTNSSQVTWINVSALNQPAPFPSFTRTAINATAVQFTDTSTDYILGRDWYFGDGTANSTDAAPVHNYPNTTLAWRSGLIVTNASGYNSTERYTYPIADFTCTPLSGPVPLAVQCTDASTGV
jgi:PKD repeat protein